MRKNWLFCLLVCLLNVVLKTTHTRVSRNIELNNINSLLVCTDVLEITNFISSHLYQYQAWIDYFHSFLKNLKACQTSVEIYWFVKKKSLKPEPGLILISYWENFILTPPVITMCLKNISIFRDTESFPVECRVWEPNLYRFSQIFTSKNEASDSYRRRCIRLGLRHRGVWKIHEILWTDQNLSSRGYGQHKLSRDHWYSKNIVTFKARLYLILILILTSGFQFLTDTTSLSSVGKIRKKKGCMHSTELKQTNIYVKTYTSKSIFRLPGSNSYIDYILKCEFSRSRSFLGKNPFPHFEIWPLPDMKGF